MMIITVKQPWAWALAEGIKPIENRSWSTQYRGLVAIHAGMAIDDDGFDLIESQVDPERIPRRDDLVRGAIVGVADLVDVRAGVVSPWAERGAVHWQFASARPITPIEYRGALGLRRLDEEIVQQVLEGLAQKVIR